MVRPQQQAVLQRVNIQFCLDIFQVEVQARCFVGVLHKQQSYLVAVWLHCFIDFSSETVHWQVTKNHQRHCLFAPVSLSASTIGHSHPLPFCFSLLLSYHCLVIEMCIRDRFYVLTRVFPMANDNSRKFEQNQIIFCIQP